MIKMIKNLYFRIAAVAVIILGSLSMSFSHNDKSEGNTKSSQASDVARIGGLDSGSEKSDKLPGAIGELPPIPVYGKWRNFTTKDGLPSDKTYCVRIDGDRVFAGTHDGLAVYQNGKWKTYTTKDGLAHNGVVSVDVSELTGDVWIGTLGGIIQMVGRKI